MDFGRAALPRSAAAEICMVAHHEEAAAQIVIASKANRCRSLHDARWIAYVALAPSQ